MNYVYLLVKILFVISFTCVEFVTLIPESVSIDERKGKRSPPKEAICELTSDVSSHLTEGIIGPWYFVYVLISACRLGQYL